MVNIENVLFCIYEAIVVFMILRVVWVHKKRVKALRYMGESVHKRLSSYNTMILKFLVWDINKFIN